MNRGSAVDVFQRGVRIVASMRPRFMNRGSPCESSAFPTGPVASMRPRFMNRGSQERIYCLLPIVPGFNEAPIHESGKFGRPVPLHGLRIQLQ